MAIIKIETKQTFIPVIIGDLEFKFELSDKNLESFHSDIVSIAQRLGELGDSDAEAMKEARKAVKEGFDTLLGDGAFDAIYEVSPSIIIVVSYFVQTVVSLSKEVRGFVEGEVDEAEKYVQKGKAQARRKPIYERK